MYYQDEVLQRFYDKIVYDKSGCHLWRTGKRGHVNLGNGVRVLATHVALEIHLGRPIADGMQVNHTCDTPACVNPEHLYEGTQLDNMRDAAERGRKAPMPMGSTPPVNYGERNGNSRVTEDLVRSLRLEREEGVSYRMLAKRFDISVSTVAQIVNRTTWKDV